LLDVSLKPRSEIQADKKKENPSILQAKKQSLRQTDPGCVPKHQSNPTQRTEIRKKQKQ
jgi:hypothetical protein